MLWFWLQSSSTSLGDTVHCYSAPSWHSLSWGTFVIFCVTDFSPLFPAFVPFCNHALRTNLYHITNHLHCPTHSISLYGFYYSCLDIPALFSFVLSTHYSPRQMAFSLFNKAFAFEANFWNIAVQLSLDMATTSQFSVQFLPERYFSINLVIRRTGQCVRQCLSRARFGFVVICEWQGERRVRHQHSHQYNQHHKEDHISSTNWLHSIAKVETL